MAVPIRLAALLAYAPRPLIYRRKRVRRAVLLSAALVTVIFMWVTWGPGVWHRLMLLRAQRLCLRFVPSTAGARSAEPLPVRWDTSFTLADADPPCLGALLSAVPGAPSAAEAGPVLFLHERRSAAGRVRLVVLRRTPPARRMSIDIPLAYTVTLVDPATAWRDPTSATFSLEEVVNPAFPDDSPGTPSASLTFFTGAADPADPSHFTFDYDVNGQRGTVDGWLRDGEARGGSGSPVTIELRVRQ